MVVHKVVQCYNSRQCGVFQVCQDGASKRFRCKICHEVQSFRKIYTMTENAKEARSIVQTLNMRRGRLRERGTASEEREEREEREMEGRHTYKAYAPLAGGFNIVGAAVQSNSSLFTHHHHHQQQQQQQQRRSSNSVMQHNRSQSSRWSSYVESGGVQTGSVGDTDIDGVEEQDNAIYTTDMSSISSRSKKSSKRQRRPQASITTVQKSKKTTSIARNEKKERERDIRSFFSPSHGEDKNGTASNHKSQQQQQQQQQQQTLQLQIPEEKAAKGFEPARLPAPGTGSKWGVYVDHEASASESESDGTGVSAPRSLSLNTTTTTTTTTNTTNTTNTSASNSSSTGISNPGVLASVDANKPARERGGKTRFTNKRQDFSSILSLSLSSKTGARIVQPIQQQQQQQQQPVYAPILSNEWETVDIDDLE